MPQAGALRHAADTAALRRLRLQGAVVRSTAAGVCCSAGPAPPAASVSARAPPGRGRRVGEAPLRLVELLARLSHVVQQEIRNFSSSVSPTRPRCLSTAPELRRRPRAWRLCRARARRRYSVAGADSDAARRAGDLLRARAPHCRRRCVGEASLRRAPPPATRVVAIIGNDQSRRRWRNRPAAAAEAAAAAAAAAAAVHS